MIHENSSQTVYSLSEQVHPVAGEVDQAVSFLKALANPQRLLILCHLLGRRLNVTEIQDATGIQQPTLSQQLSALRKSGVVVTQKQGKLVYYGLDDPDVAAVMAVLYGKFCQREEAE